VAVRTPIVWSCRAVLPGSGWLAGLACAADLADSQPALPPSALSEDARGISLQHGNKRKRIPRVQSSGGGRSSGTDAARGQARLTCAPVTSQVSLLLADTSATCAWPNESAGSCVAWQSVPTLAKMGKPLYRLE
jgi:hypothetical protein